MKCSSLHSTTTCALLVHACSGLQSECINVWTHVDQLVELLVHELELGPHVEDLGLNPTWDYSLRDIPSFPAFNTGTLIKALVAQIHLLLTKQYVLMSLNNR